MIMIESKPDHLFSLDNPSCDQTHTNSHNSSQPAATVMQRKKLITCIKHLLEASSFTKILKLDQEFKQHWKLINAIIADGLTQTPVRLPMARRAESGNSRVFIVYLQYQE